MVPNELDHPIQEWKKYQEAIERGCELFSPSIIRGSNVSRNPGKNSLEDL
jgi:hypothetical protein